MMLLVSVIPGNYTFLECANCMCRFLQRLREADPSVGDHLVAQKVDPHYFAFRWMTVLFSQDIEHLPDVLRVWDFLFGDPQGCKEAVMRFCCALLLVCTACINHHFLRLQKCIDVHVEVF